MEQLISKLEELGLKKFINTHQHRLCDNTVNQEKVAAALQLDADQISKIMHPPDNFERCQKLYEYAEKMAKPSTFLQALEETNNGHVLEFIKVVLVDMDFSSSGKYGYSSSNHSTMGIWFNLPEPIESFYGREDFLTLLHDKLKPRDDSETEVTVLSQVKIVSGLGGIGKTETARKYIMKQRKVYNNFIWINAETDNSMTNSFLQLAEEIKIAVKNTEGKSREIEEILKDIYNKICMGEKSNLIVFDNAEDYESLNKFLPFGLHPDLIKPVILATSRNQEWISNKGKIQVLPLDVLTEGESLEFILKELEILGEYTEEFKEESREFIELLGGLPLALQQAVTFIRQEKELRELSGTPYKMSEYVQEFKSSMKKFQTFSPVYMPAPSGSSPTVFVTWNVTFEKIQKLENGGEAIRILEILSFLYADKIPSTFLHDLVPEMEYAKFSRALKLLKKYSLIKTNPKDFSMSIHRQLQFVILQYLNECQDVSNVVQNLIDTCKVVLENIKLSQSSDIFLNVHQIVNNQFDLIPVTEGFLDFKYQFGRILRKASRYSESLELHKQLYSERQELLGEDHEKSLESQHEVAKNLVHLGRYEDSLALFKDNLNRRELFLGLDHPDTIDTKHNIADVFKRQNKHQEALELFEQVLVQQNKVLGENHPWTPVTTHNIALIHSNLGNFPKALELFEDVEKKQIKTLGPDHPNVLDTRHGKARVLYKMGKFEEALKIFNEVYKKCTELLGENHLFTMISLFSIARTYEQQGQLTKAMDLSRIVYEIRKLNLGENHPQTVDVKSQIVNIEAKLQQQQNTPL